MLDLTNKVVLITGLGQTTPLPTPETSNSNTPCAFGSFGIGAAIATKLASRGALIFGGNRSLASAMVTKTHIESIGGTCDIHQTDVTDSNSIKALVDACMARHGRIDVLVNNVGKSEPGDPASMSEEVWDSQVELNLKSVYLTCHFVLPIMESQPGGGSVINVSSIAGLRYIGKPQVAYSATKAAIIQFTKATGVIYAEKGTGVRLNTVVPGLMCTPYTRELAKRYAGAGAGKEGVDEEAYMAMRDRQVPMGRMGDAWDVANAVVFLASDEARYITAQEIVVDGGVTASTGRA